MTEKIAIMQEQTDFERFLINRFSDEKGIRFNNLLEWKGYNLDFKWMVDDVYSMLTDKNTRWDFTPNGRYIHIGKFMFNGVCFLGRTNISVTLRTGQSADKIGQCVSITSEAKLVVYSDKEGILHDYNPETDKDVWSGNIIYDNASVMMNISSKDNSLPEYEFKAAMWHELMHLYQVYSVLLKNRNIIPNSVKNSNLRYGNVLSRFVEYRKEGNTVMSKIAMLLYKLDGDEVNANLSMIYPFIRKNTGINHGNVMEYLPSLEIYKTVELCKEVQDMLTSAISNNRRLKDYIDGELYEIFSRQYRKEDCCRLLLKYIIRDIPHIQSKMYRNAKSALEDIGRPTIMEDIDSRIGCLL